MVVVGDFSPARATSFLFSLAASVFSLFFLCAGVCVCWRVPDRSVFGRKTGGSQGAEILTFRFWREKLISDEVAAKMWLFDRFLSAGGLRGSVSSAFLFLEIFSLGRAFSPLTNSNLILL